MLLTSKTLTMFATTVCYLLATENQPWMARSVHGPDGRGTYRMTSHAPHRRAIAATAGLAAVALVLPACSGKDDSGSDGGSTADSGASGSLVIGTTDKVTTLDPAGSYDNG